MQFVVGAAHGGGKLVGVDQATCQQRVGQAMHDRLQFGQARGVLAECGVGEQAAAFELGTEFGERTGQGWRVHDEFPLPWSSSQWRQAARLRLRASGLASQS